MGAVGALHGDRVLTTSLKRCMITYPSHDEKNKSRGTENDERGDEPEIRGAGVILRQQSFIFHL